MGLSWLFLLELCKFVGRKHRKLIYVRAVGPLLVRRVYKTWFCLLGAAEILGLRQTSLCPVTALLVPSALLRATGSRPSPPSATAHKLFTSMRTVEMVQVTIISIAIMNIWKLFKAPYNISTVGVVPSGLPGYVGRDFFPLVGSTGKTLTLAILVREPPTVPAPQRYCASQITLLLSAGAAVDIQGIDTLANAASRSPCVTSISASTAMGCNTPHQRLTLYCW